jgi:hypothetical protein
MTEHPPHHPDTIELIADAWGWQGLRPAKVIQTNAFGSILLEDIDGRIWRITPELAECTVVAEDRNGIHNLLIDDEFALDWSMGQLLPLAIATVGPLNEGECYGFKMPPVLGGGYDASNLCKLPIQEVLHFSGTIARQTRDLPDGAQVELVFED